jgi:hypothetical protein
MGARRPRACVRERLTAPARGLAAARSLATARGVAAACGAAVAAILLAVVGCGSPATSSAGTGATGAAAGMTVCGTTRTAANVPVHIQIARGQVSCATALKVERDYAQAILSGDVPGTGGGAPVRVRGWTCQGFTTPVVLKTGQASKCVRGSKEILAVLPAPA